MPPSNVADADQPSPLPPRQRAPTKRKLENGDPLEVRKQKKLSAKKQKTGTSESTHKPAKQDLKRKQKMTATPKPKVTGVKRRSVEIEEVDEDTEQDNPRPTKQAVRNPRHIIELDDSDDEDDEDPPPVLLDIEESDDEDDEDEAEDNHGDDIEMEEPEESAEAELGSSFS